MSNKFKTILAFLIILTISLTACEAEETSLTTTARGVKETTPTSAPSSSSEFEIEPINVDTVQVYLSTDSPDQAELHVKGMLGDGCSEFSGIEQTVQGQTIQVTILRRQKLTGECPEIGKVYDEVIPLQGPIAPGEYTVKVNGVETKLRVSETSADANDTSNTPENILKIATDLLAQDKSMGADEIQVISAEAVQWPNSSLGCPQPGMNYLMVVTPGYRVELEAKGQSYMIHTNEDGTQSLICAKESESQNVKAPEAVIKVATNLLAKDLSINTDVVKIVSIEDVQWRNSSMGCPQPGMNYLQVITPGYRVKLEAEGIHYFIHTDKSGNRAIICKNDTE